MTSLDRSFTTFLGDGWNKTVSLHPPPPLSGTRECLIPAFTGVRSVQMDMPSVVATSQPKTYLGRSDTHASQHVSTRSLLIAFRAAAMEQYLFVRHTTGWIALILGTVFSASRGVLLDTLCGDHLSLIRLLQNRTEMSDGTHTHTHAEVTREMFKKSNPRLQDLTEQLL